MSNQDQLSEQQRSFIAATQEFSQRRMIIVSEELRRRCRDLSNWYSTGQLTGNAFEAFAKSRFPNDHDAHQLAESATCTELFRVVGTSPEIPELDAQRIEEIGSSVAGDHWSAIPDEIRHQLSEAIARAARGEEPEAPAQARTEPFRP